MKNKRYRRIKRGIMAGAGSGIIAGMLFVGGNTALAETNAEYSQQAYLPRTLTGMHIMHRWNSRTKIGTLATQLGLNVEEVKKELKSGKTLKQILQENGIVLGQLQKAFKNKQ